VRTVPPTELTPTELAARKPEGLTISVCLPARDEAATVGSIVEVIARECREPGPDGRPLVDELLVLDDGSTDDTASVAEAAGAQVVAVDDIAPDLPRGQGKGNVLWKSLLVCRGDLVVWCDADLRSFSSSYVTRLVAPLLDDDGIGVVKGFYDRPVGPDGQGGGRTTELVARPLLRRFFPALATLEQPLSGECAARVALLEQLPFVQSYGVEIGLLIDVLGLVGLESLVQVDLGTKAHRHRSLEALSVQAAEILDTVLARAGIEPTDGSAGAAERPPAAPFRARAGRVPG
jgi:glucosyl-3-phosphoglycerate synthase